MHADFIKITENDTKRNYSRNVTKLNRNYSKHVDEKRIKNK